MAGIERWTVSEPYLHIDCALGEAPFYEAASHTLRFVDIVKKLIHVIDLNVGPESLKTYELQDAVSITADVDGAEGEEIIVGAKYGYALLDRKTGGLRYVKKLWKKEDGDGKAERMRCNDGAIDTRGRFWVGTMNDQAVTEPTDEGVVFRLDPDLGLHRVLEKVSIPNGIGWSADDRTMFFTDSPTKTIAKFDYDIEKGAVSNRRLHWKLEGEVDGAVPDGWAMDVEGCIWTAVYGAGKVLRISPGGKTIGEVLFPVRCITCPRFVGETLFVTSAVEEEPEQFPGSVKRSGSLFKVDVGVMGMPIHKWKPTSLTLANKELRSA